MSNSTNTENLSNDDNIDVNQDLIELYFKKTDKRKGKADITPKSYYLPNRPGFVKSIHEDYKDYILKAKEDDDLDSTYKDLFPHQKFVRDYLQYQSPSRGLLLFHGLGVGKTCASIAAAELLLNNKDVTVMLPASLETNYINEVIKCGHKYYAPEQHWRFIPKNNLKDLNKIKKITIIDDIIIKRNKGLWYAVEGKASNFKNLGDAQKEQIMNQLNNIVRKKYNILHYNGITTKKLNEITEDNSLNPFDNNIIIIDEVHNFISRVINGSKIAERIYSLLMEAKKCKLLCLSGTPIINKPYEIALLLNLLKGRISIYELSTKQDIDEEKLEEITKKLKDNKYIDFFNYSAIDKTLNIKLLPNNFVREDRKSDSMKIKYTEDKNLNDIETLLNIIKILKKIDLTFKIKNNNVPKKYTMLPNNEKRFLKIFIDPFKSEVINTEIFMKRILGSVSFFEYTDSKLFPSIRKNEIVKVDLSDIQLKKYIDVRRDEISKESNFKKQTGQEAEDEEGQVYKAFSRALCNFTFPEEIHRPYPSELKLLLNDLDDIDEYNRKTKYKVIKAEEKEEENKEEEKQEKQEDKDKKYLRFYSKSKEGKVLSNFAEIEVKINGKTYITGEHAFHGQKYLVSAEANKDKERKDELIKYSKLFEGKDTKFKTALDAKKAGGKGGLRLNDTEIKEWDSNKADEIQKKICLYKYKNNKEVRETLKKYKDYILIHQDNRANKNTPWGARVVNKDGVNVIIGKNKLGKTWSNILKNKTEEPKDNAQSSNTQPSNNDLEKFLKDVNFKNETECGTRSYKADFYMKKGDLINAIKKYPELVKKLPKDFHTLKKEDICKAIYKLQNQKGGADDAKFKSKNYDPADYNKKIQEILNELSDKSQKYLVDELELYSPKFAKMIKLINESEGSSLVYSQFRNVEGVGIFKRVLDANGYAQFKIKKGNGYELDIKEEDYNKPKYIEFTGDKEMTNVLLDIFNNHTDKIPDKIKEQLDKLHSNKNSEKNNEGNIRGSIIKVIMITQSGSEGISLKNVRQVHLVEPYWNMIRMDQVIGRAARTGSHLALPKKDRNIDVYRYLCKFSDKQLEERKIQRMDNGKTTDEIIHEGAERKAKITNQLLELLKSSAVDCYLHKKNHQNVTCFSYPINIDDNELSVEADIYTDLENLKNKNKEEIKLSVSVVSIKNKKYAILKDSPKARTGQLFDYETYVQFGNLEFVGLLEMNNENKLVLRLKK